MEGHPKHRTGGSGGGGLEDGVSRLPHSPRSFKLEWGYFSLALGISCLFKALAACPLVFYVLHCQKCGAGTATWCRMDWLSSHSPCPPSLIMVVWLVLGSLLSKPAQKVGPYIGL